MKTNIIETNIREYCEELPVKIKQDEETGRWVIFALNEAGHNSTSVDLLDLLRWIKKNKPELLTEAFKK